jgi:hypothetical protein
MSSPSKARIVVPGRTGTCRRADTCDRSKWHFCHDWPVFSPRDSESITLPSAKGTIGLRHGRLLSSMYDGCPLCPLRARGAGNLGATGPVLRAGGSYSGAATRNRLKRAAYGCGEPWAIAKDALERKLHRLVCAGELDLKTAQHAIASNWIEAYKK